MKKKILVGFLAGILMALVGFLFNFVFGFFYPEFQTIYIDTTIFITMDSARSLLFWIYPLVLGPALAWLYGMLKKDMKKPFNFAWLYFFIGAVPAFFINAGSFNLPVMMVFSWTVMSYFNGLVAALLFNRMLK